MTVTSRVHSPLEAMSIKNRGELNELEDVEAESSMGSKKAYPYRQTELSDVQSRRIQMLMSVGNCQLN